MRKLVAATISSVFLAAACGAGEEAAQSERQDIASERVSVPHMYSTLEELSAAAGTVVRGGAESGDTYEFKGLPLTETTFRVTEHMKGVSEDSIVVKQTGEEGTSTELLASVLTPGKEYVLFLDPYEFVRGGPVAPEKEFVVLGFGAFEVQDSTLVPPVTAAKYTDFDRLLTIDEVRAAVHTKL